MGAVVGLVAFSVGLVAAVVSSAFLSAVSVGTVSAQFSAIDCEKVSIPPTEYAAALLSA